MIKVTTSDIWIGILAIGSMIGMLYCVSQITQMNAGQVMYNCSIAEISPDFTTAMKNECRRLRATTK